MTSYGRFFFRTLGLTPGVRALARFLSVMLSLSFSLCDVPFSPFIMSVRKQQDSTILHQFTVLVFSSAFQLSFHRVKRTLSFIFLCYKQMYISCFCLPLSSSSISKTSQRTLKSLSDSSNEIYFTFLHCKRLPSFLSQSRNFIQLCPL